MKKNKLIILTIIISLSASQHVAAGYESPMIDDRLEQLDLIEDAKRTQIEEKLEQRGYTNEAGRTEAQERQAQRGDD